MATLSGPRLHERAVLADLARVEQILKSRIVSIRLDSQLWEKIKARAAAEGLAPKQWMVTWLEAGLVMSDRLAADRERGIGNPPRIPLRYQHGDSLERIPRETL